MENIKLNIYQKLFEVKKAGIKLQRDTKAFNYKYATLSQIQEKLGAELEKQNLLVIHQVVKGCVETKIIDIEGDEAISSTIEMTNGTKAQDKGSEITYYRRYNLLSLLDLEVEDDDGKKAQDSVATTQQDKPWFNEKELKGLVANKDNYKTGDEALNAVKTKYAVSKVMQEKIKKLYN